MTQARAGESLEGLRVLVVEDVLLVAEMIAEMLAAGGIRVVGPVARVASALVLAREETLDGALLDVNLAGENSGPVAEALTARGVPFIFLTGYGDAGALPPNFRDTPRIAKPFREQELATAMTARFRRTARPSADTAIG